MFRITQNPLSGRLIQCMAKNYRNGSIVSVDMDVVGVMAACCHNTGLVHVNRHERIIHVIFNQALYKAP